MAQARRSTGARAASTSTRKKASHPANKKSAGVLLRSDEGDNQYIRALVCGKPKSGKTLFASTWPKPVFIDADKGMQSVREKKIPSFPLEFSKFAIGFSRRSTPDEDEGQGWLYVRRILEDLGNKSGPFWDALEAVDYEPQTIVFDMLTSLSDLMVNEVIHNPPDGKPRDGLQLQDYNLLQNRIFDLVKYACDLPYNLVCISGLEVIQDESSRIFLQPNLVGKALGARIAHVFDEVYQLYHDTKEGKYKLSSIPTRHFEQAGSRRQVKEKELENPSYEKLRKFYE